jgi:hypothetical protein
MDENGIMSLIALIISIGGTILAIINHKKIKSKCGDKVIEASIDITNTTPPINNNEK